MVGQECGRRRSYFRKLRLENLQDALMGLPAFPLQDRLVRRFLEQGMLERVDGLRGLAALIHDLYRDQGRQVPL